MLGILISLMASTTGPGWKLLARCGGQQREFEVDEKCHFHVNGKDAAAGDLLPGDELEIDGNPAVCIKATRPVLKDEVHAAAKRGFDTLHTDHGHAKKTDHKAK